MTRARTRPTRRRSGPPRCRHCRAQIRFLWITFSRGPALLPFDIEPVAEPTAGTDYPTFGRRAWDLNELIAEIQVMRGTSVEDARAEVLDMPWHRLHRCPQGSAAHRRAQETTAP